MARTGAGTRVPLPTSRPTQERTAHAEAIEAPDIDGVAFRAWWSLATRLDRLRADGLISAAAYDAAISLRDDVHRMGRVSGSTLARIGIQVQPGEGDRHGDMLGRLGAARRLRMIRTRLGPHCYAVAYLVAVEDLSWCELARRLGVSASTARHIAAAAIGRLVQPAATGK